MADGESRRGVQLGLGAYLLWGLLPIYWKQLGGVPPLQILAHRVVWSLVFLAILVLQFRRWPAVTITLRSRQHAARYLLTAVLLAINWGVYIWAVNSGYVLESSLGYFMAPLINMLLGVLFLGERLRKLQSAAVSVAALSVLWFAIQSGTMPWIGLALAISLGFYGLLRKRAALGGIEGLFLESLFMAPLAVAFLGFAALTGDGAFLNQGLYTDLLLVLAGVVTALPLILYVGAVQRVTLVTIGVLQYVSPTCQFLLAVFLFDEPFSHDHVLLFSGIWIALTLYSIEGLFYVAKHRAGRRHVSSLNA